MCSGIAARKKCCFCYLPLQIFRPLCLPQPSLDVGALLSPGIAEEWAWAGRSRGGRNVLCFPVRKGAKAAPKLEDRGKGGRRGPQVGSARPRARFLMAQGHCLIAGPPRSGPSLLGGREPEQRVRAHSLAVLGTVPPTPRQAPEPAGRGDSARLVCTFQSSWATSRTLPASRRLAGVFGEERTSPPPNYHSPPPPPSNHLPALGLRLGVETSFSQTQPPFSDRPAAWE